MSHPEQLGFLAAVVAENAELLTGGKIIEIGSFDVNGGMRKLFDGTAEYLGVDLDNGPGVDLVCYGHEVDRPDGYFDIAVSGECFEHDPHWADTFVNMCRMTRGGGLVAFTCASLGRPEHGTKRTDLEESPGTQAQGLDYYRNLQQSDFESAIPLAQLFSEYRFWYMSTSFDLYFAGVRSVSENSGESDRRPRAKLPNSEAVAALRKVMSLPHRAVRLPLKMMLKTLPEDRYQNAILPYWRTLLKAQDRACGGRFRRAEH